MDYEYRLRKEDFIPIVGLAKHYKRCTNEAYRKKLIGNENYIANAWGREALLCLYNTSILAGAALGVKGLLNLLAK